MQLFAHPIGGKDINQHLGRLIESRSPWRRATKQLPDNTVIDFGPETVERQSLV